MDVQIRSILNNNNLRIRCVRRKDVHFYFRKDIEKNDSRVWSRQSGLKGLLNLRFRNSKGAEKVRRDERSRVTEDVGRV